MVNGELDISERQTMKLIFPSKLTDASHPIHIKYQSSTAPIIRVSLLGGSEVKSMRANQGSASASLNLTLTSERPWSKHVADVWKIVGSSRASRTVTSQYCVEVAQYSNCFIWPLCHEVESD
jgi:hypothetical protein